MALNLTTPRYHAPDVTKAPLAGEEIRSSQDRSNLARRSQAASERQAAAELGLKAEAQGVNLAERRQKMDQEWELHPEKLLQARVNAQATIESNLAAQQRLRENQNDWDIRLRQKLATMEASEIEVEERLDALDEARAQKAQEPVMSHWLAINRATANSPRFGSDPTLVITPIPPTITGDNRAKLEQAAKAWDDNGRATNSFERRQNVADFVEQHQPGMPVNPVTVKLANEVAAKAAARGQSPPFIPPTTGPASLNWFEGFLDNDGIFDRSVFDAKIKEQRASVGTATRSENVAYNTFYNTMLTKAEALEDVDDLGNATKRYTSLQDLNEIAKTWADWKFGRGIYSHVGPSHSSARPTAASPTPPAPTGGSATTPPTVHRFVPGSTPGSTGSLTRPAGSRPSSLRPIPTRTTP